MGSRRGCKKSGYFLASKLWLSLKQIPDPFGSTSPTAIAALCPIHHPKPGLLFHKFSCWAIPPSLARRISGLPPQAPDSAIDGLSCLQDAPIIGVESP